MDVINRREKRILVTMPEFLELFLFVIIAFDALRPAARHRFQFRRIVFQAQPFSDQIKAHQNGINASEVEDLVAHALTHFFGHRAHVQFTHERDGAVCGGDAHTLRVDSYEHLSDLVKRGALHGYHWDRIAKQALPTLPYPLEKPLGVTWHPWLPVLSKDVVNRNVVGTGWLAINNARRALLVAVWFNNKRDSAEVNTAARIVAPKLSLKRLKDDRQSLLTINNKPDVSVAIAEGWQHFGRLPYQVRGLAIHLPQEERTNRHVVIDRIEKFCRPASIPNKVPLQLGNREATRL